MPRYKCFYLDPITYAVTGIGILLAALSASAQITAIHPKVLPQETAILAAYDDAGAMEQYSRDWLPQWSFSISKDEVAAHLSKDVALLRTASDRHPDNSELALLTGLVGRFAYNLDLDGSYAMTLAALKRAIDLEPKDVRGRWFRAAFVCSTESPGPGAEEFLAIEAAHASSQLPAGYWEDYMRCLHIVGMPVHVLRAAKYLAGVNAGDADLREFFVSTENKRFEAVDKTKVYEEAETWSSAPLGADIVYTNTGCGIGIRMHATWKTTDLRLAKGDCKASFDIGSYGKDKTTADVTIFVESQKPNQTLKDFLYLYMPEGNIANPESIDACPVASCMGVRIVKTGDSSKDEPYRHYAVLFERDAPEFPGLALEFPNPPRVEQGTEGPVFFHPDQLKQRVPGKIYYAVYLSVATEFVPQALQDFIFLVQNLRVD
ncbi:MAG TPA: hypothetical protein VHZ52_12580 [Acidobacteriaceae bacterium]|jgi:hypothetical protein|nr:hypothetical protein [Acidobacteriaceae bacterium]